jgi:hypothetical protein
MSPCASVPQVTDTASQSAAPRRETFGNDTLMPWFTHEQVVTFLRLNQDPDQRIAAQDPADRHTCLRCAHDTAYHGTDPGFCSFRRNGQFSTQCTPCWRAGLPCVQFKQEIRVRLSLTSRLVTMSAYDDETLPCWRDIYNNLLCHEGVTYFCTHENCLIAPPGADRESAGFWVGYP